MGSLNRLVMTFRYHLATQVVLLYIDCGKKSVGLVHVLGFSCKLQYILNQLQK